jgi:hypothetical protein
MVRRFINASKIEIYKKKNPTAAAHGGRSIHTAVACGVTWGPHCHLTVGSYHRGPWRQGPNAVARGGKTYGPTAGGSYRRGARRYISDVVGHGGRCIVLQNFGRTIYFLQDRYRKIYLKNSCLSPKPQDRTCKWRTLLKQAGRQTRLANLVQPEILTFHR